MLKYQPIELKKLRQKKEFFIKTIKQVSPESHEIFKFDYHAKDNISLLKLMKKTTTKNQYNEINSRIQNLFRSAQKDSKSVFYSISNLCKTLINQHMLKTMYL